MDDKELENSKRRMEVIKAFNDLGVSCEKARKAFDILSRTSFVIKRNPRRPKNK